MVYYIDHLLGLLENCSQSTLFKGALILLKDAIHLISCGGHPIFLHYYLIYVEDYIRDEDMREKEDLTILFDCLKYLDILYPL